MEVEKTRLKSRSNQIILLRRTQLQHKLQQSLNLLKQPLRSETSTVDTESQVPDPLPAITDPRRQISDSESKGDHSLPTSATITSNNC